MREIVVQLLDEDYMKLRELARKNGFHSSNEFARKELEDKIRTEYRKMLS